MNRVAFRCALLLLGIALFPASAFAHPVVDISYWLGFKLDSKGLEGINETWEFDQEHSTQILQMFDANHDGKIEPSELPALEQGYFDHLKQYSYFTTIVIDGKAAATGTASKFSADYHDNRMFYHFHIALRISASKEEHEVDVTIWDPTYFTDLEPANSNAITVQAPENLTAKIYTANDHRHFYNMAPDVILIKKPPFYLPMQVLKFKISQP